MRLSAWLVATLAPFDDWIRRHTWLTSMLTGLAVATVALVTHGWEDAVAAFIGIVPTLRFMLWLIIKGAFPTGSPPIFPP